MVVAFSESDDALLPALLRPLAPDDLIRLGRANEGGYVLSARSVSAADLVLGFGLDTDWSFEVDAARIANAPVIANDHTVTARSWTIFLAKKLFRLLTSGRPIHAREIIRPLAFHRFFDGRRNLHVRERVGYASSGATDLKAVFARSRSRNILLKIDIETDEYRLFPDLPRYAGALTGLVVEVHHVDLLLDRVVALVDELAPTMALVHVHANNGGGITPAGGPVHLELSFLARRLIRDGEVLRPRTLPISGLDQPNVPSMPDVVPRFAPSRA